MQELPIKRDLKKCQVEERNGDLTKKKKSNSG